MRILVIGSGLIGSQRVQALTRNPLISEIAIFDPRLAPGTQVSSKAVSVDEDRAFCSGYDAAIVATPHDAAVEMLERVIPLVRFALVEKPLGRNLTEARMLIACAQASHTRLFVGLNYRFLKNVQHAARLLRSGELGRVLCVDAVLSHGAAPGYEKSWKTDLERCGGGVCIDPGIHLFDILFWLFGDVALVTGHLSRLFWRIQVEDHASLILSLADDAVASLNLSLSSWKSRMEITIETDKAQLMIRGRGKFYGSQQLIVIAKWPWLQPEEPRETLFDYGVEDLSLQQETDEFISSICDVSFKGTIATAGDAMRAMEIVDACYGKLARKG
jgi:predicted dehydrogenase